MILYSSHDPNIFISYSHIDEIDKDEIIKHLKPLSRLLRFRLEPWSDTNMACGDLLRPEIKNAIDNSEFAILLVSANFLSSDFITDEELPYILEKQRSSDLRIMPFIIKPCDWQAHGWLQERLVRPKDGRPPMTEYEKALSFSEFAEEIRIIATRKIQQDESIKFFPNQVPRFPESKTKEIPDSYVTKSFLIRKVLTTFYGDSISDLAIAFADPHHPTYPDVPSSNPDFPFIEIAKGLEIVSAQDEFKPDQPATKSEILKVILLTGDVPTLLKPYPDHFADIKEHENEEYIVSAYNNGLLIEYSKKEGEKDIIFEPNGPLTIGEFLGWLKLASKNHDKVIQVKTKIPHLEVSISDFSPDSSSIPIKGMNIPLLALDFSNPSIEDVYLNGLIISHSGLGNPDEITAINFFDGIKKIGRDIPFIGNEKIAPINFGEKNVLIAAGTSKTLVVAADTNADESDAGSEHSVSILDNNDIIAISREDNNYVEVKGSFPLIGKKFLTTSIRIGELYLNLIPEPVFARVTKGTENVLLGHMLIKSEYEPILIQSLSFIFNGIKDGDIQNIYLLDERKQLISKTEQSTKDNSIVFDLMANDDEGFIVEKEIIRRVAIIGTPIVSGRNMRVEFKTGPNSVMAQGKNYGFGANVKIGGISTLIQLI